MLHPPVSLMNRISQSESAVFPSLKVYFPKDPIFKLFRDKLFNSSFHKNGTKHGDFHRESTTNLVNGTKYNTRSSSNFRRKTGRSSNRLLDTF